MTPRGCLEIVCGSLVFLSLSTGTVLAQALPAPTPEAIAAAKASPELVNTLSKELGSTPEQAAGAAGSLFSVAQTRLKPEEFSQIAKAVPGMDALLKAAPGGGGGGGGAISQLGGAGGLANVAGMFSKLGLAPGLVSKAIPVLTQFLTKSGGSNVAGLLAGVLK